MGKQGPCYHCGVTSTPLWRNGPPDKPVLCNACGSRWRTKGTLANYTPLHARAELDDYEDHRVSKVKSISINKNKGMKVLKRKLNHDSIINGGFANDYSQGFRKVIDEDTSNRSSSGSAISNSESYAQFGSGDASDLTGPAQSVVWDSTVPSRKRTCINRSKPSPVEKLTKDLCTILHEQQSSYFSGSSEEDLLFESETPMVSVEIGHGSVLIRHPTSVAREEESEASSLSVENRQYLANETYSRSVTLLVDNMNKIVNAASSVEKAKQAMGQGMQLEQPERDKFQHEKLQLLGSCASPLCNIDFNDILNFEEFTKNLSSEEQQQLFKYLPSSDTAKLHDSLGNMFDSPQFKENLCSFQQLLEEGVFDVSFSDAKTEDHRTLKRLVLFNLMKSKWVEHYNQLKKLKNTIGKLAVGRGPNAIASNSSVIINRSLDSQNHTIPEARGVIKSPKRVITKASYESKELIDDDGSCFSPRSLFALPSESSSFLLDSLYFVDESPNQDLLLDVPSNSSFPQAELLNPTVSFGQLASTSSSSRYPHLVRPKQFL